MIVTTPRPDERRLRDAYLYCRQVTRSHAKTFYFASMFLPKQKRDSCYSIYAFCRYIDDIADQVVHDEHGAYAKAQVLDTWEADLKSVYHGDAPNHPVLIAWADTNRRYGIPWEHAEALIEGVRSDLTFAPLRNFEELEAYCYRVASVVGLMTARIFEYDRSDALGHARDLGTAMQLTNILRDVGEDARNGRVYLPLDELAQFNVPPDEIHAGLVTDRFVAMMQFQIERARAFFRSADLGIPMLHPDSQLTVSLMSSNYRRILDAIERNRYDVFRHRARLSFAEKAAVLPSLAWHTTTRRLTSMLPARRASFLPMSERKA